MPEEQSDGISIVIIATEFMVSGMPAKILKEVMSPFLAYQISEHSPYRIFIKCHCLVSVVR